MAVAEIHSWRDEGGECGEDAGEEEEGEDENSGRSVVNGEEEGRSFTSSEEALESASVTEGNASEFSVAAFHVSTYTGGTGTAASVGRGGTEDEDEDDDEDVDAVVEDNVALDHHSRRVPLGCVKGPRWRRAGETSASSTRVRSSTSTGTSSARERSCEREKVCRATVASTFTSEEEQEGEEWLL